MPKADQIRVYGEIVEVLPNTTFKIKLDSGQIIDGHLSGKIRVNSIKVIMGDKVTAEMSPYDLTKGRIVQRSKL